MSTTLRVLALFPFLILLPQLLLAGSNKHTETVELTGAFSPTASVHISNINGSVIIHTWDRHEYRLAAIKKSREEDNLERIELRHDISFDHAKLEVHIPKKKGWFFTSRIQGSVEIELWVPSSVNLDQVSTTNGSVKLSNVSGTVNASSVNGRIEAFDLAGRAKLNTVNGSIRASFKALAADSGLSFNSVNGGIDIRLPDGTNAELDSSVVNGRIHSDFPITLRGGTNGKELNGTIGAGGPRLSAHTVNGSIRWQQN